MRFDETKLKNPGLTWTKAYLLAEACKLSYNKDLDEIESTLRSDWNMEGDAFSKGDTQGFVAVGATSAIVAFRGTQGLSDWGSNLNILSKDFPPSGGRVHGGFLNAWRDAEDLVSAAIARVEGSRSVWITGHSLGGAVALLGAVAQAGRRLSGVVTYGQPRSVNRDAARTITMQFGTRYIRIVNDRDTVPKVPRSYSHTGGLLHFDGNGDLKTRAGTPSSLESSMENVDEEGPEALTAEEEAALEAFLKEKVTLNPDGSTDEAALEGNLPMIADHRIDAYVNLMKDQAFPDPTGSS